MKSATRGNAAEARILAEFVARGLDVLTPFGSGHPYDLAVDLGASRFLRIQCKTAWLVGESCLAFHCRSTDHGRGRRPYDHLADLFGVHFPPHDGVYLVPVAEVPGHLGRLRLEPAKNNQRRGVRFADDFEIDRWTLERLALFAGAPVAPAP
jgi:PD-(D/E)XK endonuclease